MTDAVFSLNTYSKNSPVKYFTFSFIFVIYLFLLQMPFMWILLLYALLSLLISLITLQYCRYIHKGIVKNIIPFINIVNVFFFLFLFFFSFTDALAHHYIESGGHFCSFWCIFSPISNFFRMSFLCPTGSQKFIRVWKNLTLSKSFFFSLFRSEPILQKLVHLLQEQQSLLLEQELSSRVELSPN